MSFFDNIKGKIIDTTTSGVLDTFARSLVNKYLDGIMELHEIKIVNKRPVLTFSLEGVPEYIHTAEVGLLDISPDGRKVMIGDFKCNTAFIENALNKFAARTIDIPDDKAALALAGVRKVLL